MNYYFNALKKYAVFSGRARRKEFWMFHLFNVIVTILLVIIEGMLGMDSGDQSGWLVMFYRIFIIIPTLAVAVRRMHDVDKNGWYVIFPIYNIILACTDGDSGDNEYGHDPKTGDGEVKHVHKNAIAENGQTTHGNAKHCTQCGVKHSKDAKFCSSCGNHF